MTQARVSAPRTQRERSELTTATLIAVARELFARDGYSDTSLNAVVDVAGVTKGAVYHHFAGKRDLFAAVYEYERERLAERVQVAYRDQADPWQALHAGVRAFLEAMLEPGTQRIVLVDGPLALGRPSGADLPGPDFVEMLQTGIRRAIEADLLPPRPPEPLAHLLFGAVCEAATVVSRSSDQRRAMREMLAELRTVLDALVTRPA